MEASIEEFMSSLLIDLDYSAGDYRLREQNEELPAHRIDVMTAHAADEITADQYVQLATINEKPNTDYKPVASQIEPLPGNGVGVRNGQNRFFEVATATKLFNHQIVSALMSESCMSTNDQDSQSELFDSEGTSDQLNELRKAIHRPEKFLGKSVKAKSLAFGFQNQYNILGHVCDIVDQLPLYSVDRKVPSTDGSCDPITIPGEVYHGKNLAFTYKLTITPNARFAQIIDTTSGGRQKITYEPIYHDIKDHPNTVIFRPGPREDMVEKALRRIARRLSSANPGQPIYRAGFTLYQLRKELSRSGHEVRWRDLKDSLHILGNTGITLTVITPDGREITHRTDYISQLTWGSRARNSKEYDPENDRWYCTLNDIVAYSLRNEKYQAFQHDLYLCMNTFLARRILATLSIEWRNAHVQTGYTRSMNELLLRYQTTLNDRLFNDVRAMEKALDELVEKHVLSSYKMEKVVMGSSRANKDYLITMFPTSRFVSTQIEAIGDRTVREQRHELKLPTMQLEFDA